MTRLLELVLHNQQQYAPTDIARHRDLGFPHQRAVKGKKGLTPPQHRRSHRQLSYWTWQPNLLHLTTGLQRSSPYWQQRWTFSRIPMQEDEYYASGLSATSPTVYALNVPWSIRRICGQHRRGSAIRRLNSSGSSNLRPVLPPLRGRSMAARPSIGRGCVSTVMCHPAKSISGIRPSINPKFAGLCKPPAATAAPTTLPDLPKRVKEPDEVDGGTYAIQIAPRPMVPKACSTARSGRISNKTICYYSALLPTASSRVFFRVRHTATPVEDEAILSSAQPSTSSARMERTMEVRRSGFLSPAPLESKKTCGRATPVLC